MTFMIQDRSNRKMLTGVQPRSTQWHTGSRLALRFDSRSHADDLARALRRGHPLGHAAPSCPSCVDPVVIER